MSSLTQTARDMLKQVPYVRALAADEFERLAAGCELRALGKARARSRKVSAPRESS